MKKRYSGFELLRIFMMVQIIFLHLCDKGGYTEVAKTLPKVHYVLWYFIWLMSRCPIYVFMMLTGYFLVKKNMGYKEIISRIKKIYIPMIFYSIVITMLGVLFNMWNMNDVNIYKVFTPFLSCSWYFLTGYILLIILSPYLNKLAINLTKKEYRNLIIILICIFCIWTPLANLKPFSNFIKTFQNISNNGGKSLYDYVFMYLLGGYLSLHVKQKEKIKFNYIGIFILCGVVQLFLVIFYKNYRPIAGYNDNLFAVIQAICLILFFREFKFYSKTINYIASFTLPIYIIHEHYMLKWWFWREIIHLNKTFFNSYFYPIKIIGICVGIFAICVLIDIVRRAIFKGMSKVKNLNVRKMTIDS